MAAATSGQAPALHPQLRERIENTIRFLAVDAVQRANSGHPGAPMGLACLAFELWDRHLRFDPRDPRWPLRDRFVLSNGHASMLLYALLHLYGFELPMEQLQAFRQLHSKTPGHPEYGDTVACEVRGECVLVGLTDALIPWPVARRPRRKIESSEPHPSVIRIRRSAP